MYDSHITQQKCSRKSCYYLVTLIINVYYFNGDQPEIKKVKKLLLGENSQEAADLFIGRTPIIGSLAHSFELASVLYIVMSIFSSSELIICSIKSSLK